MATAVTETPATEIDPLMARLVAFEPTRLPVLSIYLNTQSNEHGRAADAHAYLERELNTLSKSWAVGSASRESFDHDTDRILSYVTARSAEAVNGVVLFACWGAGKFFESIQLAVPVTENLIYVADQPHLYHLALLSDQYPRYAAVLTDANRARIFVFALGQTIDTEEVTGEKVHRVKVGGWSQARYQRRAQNAHLHHAKEVVSRLEHIIHEDKVSRIIIAGDPLAVPLLVAELPSAMAPMVDALRLDVHSSEHEVFRATLEKLQDDDAKSDADKVQRLLNEYRGRGLAVAGVKATLAALEAGQVDELLISACLDGAYQAELTRGSTAPPTVALPELLVTKAKQTDASIHFVEDSTLLETVGGVGAFLRWRA
jgi:peptide subunit release factor 1 (eRF1)